MPKKRRVGRPPGKTFAAQVAFRLTADLIERIDTYAASMSTPGLEITRADAARMLLYRGLDAGQRTKAPR